MKHLTRVERLAIKRAHVDFMVAQSPRFHIVAELPPSMPFRVLGASLRAWDARVNRLYLGRSWQKPINEPKRMFGIVLFESGRSREHHHAHLVIRPPADVDDDHFLANAKYGFEPHPDPAFFIKPVTTRGIMHVQKIGASAKDVTSVASYITKEFEGGERAIRDWKFLRDLNG
jgi:hypothetical protein